MARRWSPAECDKTHPMSEHPARRSRLAAAVVSVLAALGITTGIDHTRPVSRRSPQAAPSGSTRPGGAILRAGAIPGTGPPPAVGPSGPLLAPSRSGGPIHTFTAGS
ncbi:MAG: hypothetical protein NVS3B12_18390 [Acidimicrobiales bacterium]